MAAVTLSTLFKWSNQSCNGVILAKAGAGFSARLISEHHNNGVFRELFLQCNNPRAQISRGNGNPRVCKIEAVKEAYRKVKMPLLDPGDSLYKRLSRLGDPNLSAVAVLQQWIDEGRKVKKWDLQGYVRQLRKYRRYKHALEVSEWIASRRNYQLSPADAAIRLDLIAKVHGIESAEKYFEGLPDAAKNRLTYGALLNAYVKANLAEKAEAIMEKVKISGYATTALNYNAMMNLYMQTHQFEKVPLVVQEMRRNGISPDAFSYNIWITTCAAMSDVDSIEKVMDEVKHDNSVNTDWTIYSTVANMYIKADLVDKAESALNEVKNKMPKGERSAYEYLISQYASLDNKEEMYTIWESLKTTFPKLLNRSYIFMLSSLVKLGDLEGAEAIFKEWESVCATYDIRVPNMILGFYVRERLLEKAELLFEHILERGGKPNFNTWEILAEGYIENENFEKAITAMKNSALVGKSLKWQPKPENVHAILTHIEKHGDVESADDFFKMLRDLNHVNAEIYNFLLRTYIKAGKSDHKMLERIKNAMVTPNEETQMLLKRSASLKENSLGSV
uniref:Pentacotripeptide-repeat region of PRORP domain-containing protein n=1 Tax=Araucaria cunninghamii TaxID=56994 RepID=A0A0D6RA33_ARACU